MIRKRHRKNSTISLSITSKYQPRNRLKYRSRNRHRTLIDSWLREKISIGSVITNKS